MAKRKRKGQGSLEFLMTYSWALIIVLIVGIVVWRWGLFSFTGPVNEESYGFWGVTPIDFKMDTNGELTLSIQNNVGANITLNSVIGMSATANVTVLDGSNIGPGNTRLVYISNLETGTQGERYEVFVIINYSDSRMEAGRERLSSGTLWGPYE